MLRKFSPTIYQIFIIYHGIGLFPSGQALVITNRHRLALWNPQTNNINVVDKNEYKVVDTHACMLSNKQLIVSHDGILEVCDTNKKKTESQTH